MSCGRTDMSGKKRVIVDSDELQRLRQNEQRLRTVQANLPEVMNAIRRESAADYERRLAPLEQRQLEYERSIAGMKGQVAEIERETARRIAAQQREARQELE